MTPLLLAPFELVYASAVRLRNARFDRGTPERLQWPVVSIGNLSVGGAGKTPLVICLAQLLLRQGWLPDVLSRGYGRYKQSGRPVERVDPMGSATQFGDEPLLIARTTGVPVYVGNSRYAAGLMAEGSVADSTAGNHTRHVHLLDDGFQHRQLARAVDIVVVHKSDVGQHLLPAGRLREPLSSLRRAHVLVLRAEDAELESALRPFAKEDCFVWRIRRLLTLSRPAQRAMAFCAIARPQEFFHSLANAGVPIAARMRFRDHHHYTGDDIDRLAQIGKGAGCDAFVITAKDEVKLDAGLRQRLEAIAPVVTARLTVEIEDEAAALAALSSLLGM